MVDPRTRQRDFIHIGDTVKIAFTKTQRESDYIEGIVQLILSEKNYDEDGIEVQLHSGYEGHVKEIIDKSDPKKREERIITRENEIVERKETFGFDVRNDKKNPEMKKVVVTAVVSLMNTFGGYVYIGVHDNGIVRGLEKDYSIIFGGGDNDKLEKQIRDALEKNLDDYVIVSNNISISFPTVFGHEICEIEVGQSPEPIFFKRTSRMVSINGTNTPTNFDNFYIRDGNGKKLLETHREFLLHWKIRFRPS